MYDIVSYGLLAFLALWYLMGIAGFKAQKSSSEAGMEINKGNLYCFLAVAVSSFIYTLNRESGEFVLLFVLVFLFSRKIFLSLRDAHSGEGTQWTEMNSYDKGLYILILANIVYIFSSL